MCRKKFCCGFQTKCFWYFLLSVFVFIRKHFSPRRYSCCFLPLKWVEISFIADSDPNMLDNLDMCDAHPYTHRCNTGWGNNWKIRYKSGKKTQTINTIINMIMTRAVKLNHIMYSPPPASDIYHARHQHKEREKKRE